jgi:predicted RNase H-like HicB family nuclease
MQYTAIIKQDSDWWIGWIEEVPGVNCQEKTHDALINALKITLKEAIDFNKQDAIISAGKGYEEEIIAV